MDYSLRPRLRPEPVETTAPTSKGLGTPTSKLTGPVQDDWYTRFEKAFTLAGGDITGTPYVDADPSALYQRKEMSISDFDELTRRSAEMAALNRMELGITKSVTKPETPEEDIAEYDTEEDTSSDIKSSIFDALFGKDEDTEADTDKSSGLMSRRKKVDDKGTPPTEMREGLFDAAVADAKDIAVENIGITSEMWNKYRKEVSKIESGGYKNPYQVSGGANDHYDGKYQMGRVAKEDAGQLLGLDLKHDAKAREEFRNNPTLQEKAFAAYTSKNHEYLTKKSPKYRKLPIDQKLAVLGYAHNQGWSGAKTWLETGKEGKDAFGTKGTKYYDAIINNLSSQEE